MAAKTVQKQKLVATGLKELDALLQGGFPVGSVILVEGPPGIGKRALTFSFLSQGLKQREKAAYIFAGQTKQEIESQFSAYALESRGLAWILADGLKAEEKDFVEVQLSDLLSIENALKNFLGSAFAGDKSSEQVRLGINILSHALMLNEPLSVYKFFLSMAKEFKKANATAMISLEEGMHEEKQVRAMEQLSDFVLQMGFEGMQSFLSFKKFSRITPKQKKTAFELTGKGIVFEKVK